VEPGKIRTELLEKTRTFLCFEEGTMKKLALSLAMLLIAGIAFAADSQVIVNIPYTFTVSGKELPAGEYIIQRTGVNDSILVIRSEHTKTPIVLEVLTRIDGKSAADPNARIVLDKFEGDKYVLSEVHFPGEDGFLLAGAKNTPHKHETIRSKKS
jgi:hypothetical protein